MSDMLSRKWPPSDAHSKSFPKSAIPLNLIKLLVQRFYEPQLNCFVSALPLWSDLFPSSFYTPINDYRRQIAETLRARADVHVYGRLSTLQRQTSSCQRPNRNWWMYMLCVHAIYLCEYSDLLTSHTPTPRMWLILPCSFFFMLTLLH